MPMLNFDGHLFRTSIVIDMEILSYQSIRNRQSMYGAQINAAGFDNDF
jgi:hypothetical protein